MFQSYRPTGLTYAASKGVIDERLFGWAEALRKERNIGAHASDEDTTKENAQDIIDFTIAIFDYVYTLTEKYDKYLARKSLALGMDRLSFVPQDCIGQLVNASVRLFRHMDPTTAIAAASAFAAIISALFAASSARSARRSADIAHKDYQDRSQGLQAYLVDGHSQISRKLLPSAAL
jgi:hypothetical protein